MHTTNSNNTEFSKKKHDIEYYLEACENMNELLKEFSPEIEYYYKKLIYMEIKRDIIEEKGF